MITISVALAAACLGLLGHYLVEKRALRSHLDRLDTDALESSLDVALILASDLHDRIEPNLAEHFLVPALAPLGSTPGRVLEVGGCCSGITRLYIVLLAEEGIDASQITLYDTSGRGKHCLAEVRTEDVTVAVDPTYGFWFGDDAGRPIGLEELREGVDPVFTPLPGQDATDYPDDDYYDWVYDQTKTASWTRSRLRRFVYRWAGSLLGDRLDRLRLHPLLEWPQILLLAPLGVLLAFAVFRITSR